MPWTTFDDVIKADRKRGVTLPLHGNATGNLTAAGVNSGGLSIIPLFGAAGTTLWSTFKGFPLPPGVDASTDWRALWAKNGSTRIGGYWVALFYKIGTVDLTSTGQKLVHHSAGFPITRSLAYGTQAVRGFPVIITTAATSTTAPVIGNIKYVNGDGNVVTGTQSFTYPATNTVLGSSFLLSLEDEDESIQDITEVNVTTASAAGNASVWLAEPVLPSSVMVAGSISQSDALRGSRFGLPRINPAAPASGSLEWVCGLLSTGGAAASTGTALLRVVPQT